MKIRSFHILSWKIVFPPRFPFLPFGSFVFYLLFWFAPLFYIYVQSAVITMRFDCIAHSVKILLPLARFAFFFCVRSLVAIVSIFSDFFSLSLSLIFRFFQFFPSFHFHFISLVCFGQGDFYLFTGQIIYFSLHVDHFV